MMDTATAFRRALVDLDVSLIRRVWKYVAAHLPQPTSDHEALIALHVARTASESVSTPLRIYSHKWLAERNLPSQLPDHLLQPADRRYPVVVGAVGISVNSQHIEVKNGVHGVMQEAVLDCYGNGDEDPKIVKPRMMAARKRELKGFGLG